MASIYIGTAGWPIPAPLRAEFPEDGTLLARYARRFSAVEINSSFYRPHRPATYARWAAAVPADFRFSVKAPRAITHEHRLEGVGSLLTEFVAQCGGLGDRLGVLLVQLPPSLGFDDAVANRFFEQVRSQYPGPVALEPRHGSWFSADATARLRQHRISRAAADPALVPDAALPGGGLDVAYYRLHGSPRMYYSAYDRHSLDQLAGHLVAHRRAGTDAWCIFDNTAAGAATGNALEVEGEVRSKK